jgi:hypothetical protein
MNSKIENPFRRLSNDEYQQLSIEEKVAYIRRQAELVASPPHSAGFLDPGALLKSNTKR